MMRNSGRIDFLRALFICFALLSSFIAIDCNRAEELSSEVQISNVESSTVDAISREAGARKVLTINGVEVAFRWCPAGNFTMGSPVDEEERGSNEAQHDVILTQGFWLAETETTQALWKAVMGRNPSWFTGDDLHPVERVSWDNCQAFIHKLNAGAKGAGVGVFRLPTEAEWEYACRAGTTTAFPWGNVLNGDKANCNGRYPYGTREEKGKYLDPYGTEEKGKYLKKTTRVGSYESNAWGLYDMNGNVWEWCQDWYSAYPSGTVTDPQGTASGSYRDLRGLYRVLRGGSWDSDPGCCRSACERYLDPAIGIGDLGFRLAMTGESALFESSSKTEESASTSDEESEAASSAKVEIVASSDDSSTVDASSREVGARKVLTINGVEVAFRWCPAGSFTMGSPEDEEERWDVETQHEVILTQGFWLAETETTQALWKAVMGRNPSWFTGDDLHPVERVSWDNCQAFIHKLNAGAKGAGVGVFRLPTEAEWEYACRAGTTTAFPWGNVLNGDKANCNGRYPYGTREEKGKYLDKTTRVGSFESNAWGLYDMIGNVGEWCQDWYDDYPSGTQTDPQGAASGSFRVLRGGSWDYAPRICRSACRNSCDPARRISIIGFRLAMTGESALFESSSK